jgi:hypothetical protein
MSSEAQVLSQAREVVAKWLPSDTREDVLGQPTSGRLSARFIEIARLAGFGMGIIVTDDGYLARWTHPRLKSSDLPVAGFASNAEDASVLACVALLRSPKCLDLLEPHRH